MQARSCRGLSFEQLPGAEKVQPGAETGLADAQLSIRRQRGEAFAQRVVLKEYVAGFVETAGAGEIDVAKGAGKRLTLLVPVEAGVLEIGHRNPRLAGGGILVRRAAPRLVRISRSFSLYLRERVPKAGEGCLGVQVFPSVGWMTPCSSTGDCLVDG